MKANLLLSCAAAVMCIAIGSIAFAQAPAPPSVPPGAAPRPPAGPPPATYDQNQLPEARGTVQRFTLTPIGELDGVILTDGTQVHMPPHLTTQLASAVRVGDMVTVRGYRSPSVSLVVATGRSYGFGDWAKTNKASKRPLTQASLRCKRWLKPSSLQRIPTPLNRC